MCFYFFWYLEKAYFLVVQFYAWTLGFYVLSEQPG